MDDLILPHHGSAHEAGIACGAGDTATPGQVIGSACIFLSQSHASRAGSRDDPRGLYQLLRAVSVIYNLASATAKAKAPESGESAEKPGRARTHKGLALFQFPVRRGAHAGRVGASFPIASIAKDVD